MRPKEILRTMDRVDSSVLSDLGIGEWSDVTSIKVIRDRDRNIKSIKIKNSKADIGDKSRKIEATDPNFESAKKLLNAYQDKKTEEEEEERR